MAEIVATTHRAKVLTAALQALQAGAALCQNAECEHSLPGRHAVVSGDSAVDIIQRALGISKSQAQKLNNDLGRLRLRNSQNRGSTVWAHYVSVEHGTVSVRMITQCNDEMNRPACSVDCEMFGQLTAQRDHYKSLSERLQAELDELRA